MPSCLGVFAGDWSYPRAVMLSATKESLRKPLQPVAGWLDAAGVRANHVTIAGLVASALAAVSLAMGQLVLALIWFVVALLCDMVDGDLARLRPENGSPFGAFLDSTVDRISESLVFGGLLIGKQAHDGPAGWFWLLLWVLALSGSFMVSYTRARAEGLSTDCKVGLAERPERMVLMVLLLIFGLGASGWFLLILSILTWWTVYQRISHVAGRLLGPGEAADEPPAPEGEQAP